MGHNFCHFTVYPIGRLFVPSYMARRPQNRVFFLIKYRVYLIDLHGSFCEHTDMARRGLLPVPALKALGSSDRQSVG